MNMHKLASPGNLLTYILFCATTIIVIMSLAPAIFPILFIAGLERIDDMPDVNSLEFGVLAPSVLITNTVAMSLITLQKTGKLHPKITRIFVRIFSFEISKKMALVSLIIIIATYAITSSSELFDNKFDADYYGIFKPWLETFNVLELPDNQLNHDLGHHMQLFLEVISMKVFGNYKITPYLASIALLIMVYLLTLEITKKRFAGIIAVLLVIQSEIFLFYDTNVSYTNLWTFFFLLTLYLIFKRWQISPITFILGVLSKGLTATFLPVLFLFAYRAKIPSRKILVSYITVAILGGGFLLITGESLNPVDSKRFDAKAFIGGFTAFSTEFIHDMIIVSFLLPLVVGLFILSKNGNRYADPVMMLILIMLMSSPFLSALTDNQNVPYRFVPVIAFFAIGTGLVFSKNSN